jgi:transcriptional regulator with XRE-family HTH domain
MTKEQLGSFIKNERELQNLTQVNLAKKAGLSRRQVIIEIEQAKIQYPIDVLIKVAGALGFEVNFKRILADRPVTKEPINEPLKKDTASIIDFSKIPSAKHDTTITTGKKNSKKK